MISNDNFMKIKSNFLYKISQIIIFLPTNLILNSRKTHKIDGRIDL
jgi:hypothetical protein